MTLAKKILAERTASLELVRAYTKDDKPFFAYIVIKVSELEKLKQKKPDEVFDLSKNTIILHRGEGHDVPEEIKEYALREFKKLLKDPDQL